MMTDSPETKTCQLETLGFPRHVARAWVRAKGRCEYCHRDLIADRLGYAVQETDHLLPQVDFTSNFQNAVLSCNPCNRVKGAHNVLDEEECAEKMLSCHRDKLIDRARNHIECQYRQKGYDQKWKKVKRILLA